MSKSPPRASILNMLSHESRLSSELFEKSAELDELREWTPDSPQVAVVFDELSILREEQTCLSTWMQEAACH